METNNGDSIPLDFIFEGTDSDLIPPICSIITEPDDNNTGVFGAFTGEKLFIELIGFDLNATELTVTAVSIPSGAIVSPTGSGLNVPVFINFTWIPSSTQLGSFSASIQVTDVDLQTDLCVIPIFVNQPTAQPTPMPTQNVCDCEDEFDELETLICNKFEMVFDILFQLEIEIMKCTSDITSEPSEEPTEHPTEVPIFGYP